MSRSYDNLVRMWMSRPGAIPSDPKDAGEVTPKDLKNYPAYYIVGPGRDAAESTRCPCGNRWMTDTECECYSEEG